MSPPTILRITALLVATQVMMGNTDGNLGWIEPFLSPALVLTVGIFIWREVSTARKADADAKAREANDRAALNARLTGIEQLLLGYQEQGGLLHRLDEMVNSTMQDAKRRHDLANHIQSMQATIEDLQLWATRAGIELKVPYERRQTR